jgi:hypothetical protein
MSYVEHNVVRNIAQEHNELCKTQYVSSHRRRTK